jgi:hypothetical protein
MPNYWWVNHKRTFKQEISSGYLWSPKTEAGGSRSQFYDNMRLTSPDDWVVSYADTAISYVGRIAGFCVTAPKPAEFGQAGTNWSVEGWRVPTEWVKLNRPVYPRSIIEQLVPLLPKKYSPFNVRTARGNQKAYLAAISEGVFDLVLREGGVARKALESLVRLAGASSVDQIEDEIELEIKRNRSLTETEKDQLIKARRGQGSYRKNVIEVESSCRVTGIFNPNLLIASHMRPWRSCATPDERLDGYNGLLLSPHIDFLFDRGFISFDDQGHLLISSRLAQADAAKLGLLNCGAPTMKPFLPEQLPYIRYHRSNVFMS